MTRHLWRFALAVLLVGGLCPLASPAPAAAAPTAPEVPTYSCTAGMSKRTCTAIKLAEDAYILGGLQAVTGLDFGGVLATLGGIAELRALGNGGQIDPETLGVCTGTCLDNAENIQRIALWLQQSAQRLKEAEKFEQACEFIGWWFECGSPAGDFFDYPGTWATPDVQSLGLGTIPSTVGMTSTPMGTAGSGVIVVGTMEADDIAGCTSTGAVSPLDGCWIIGHRSYVGNPSTSNRILGFTGRYDGTQVCVRAKLNVNSDVQSGEQCATHTGGPIGVVAGFGNLVGNELSDLALALSSGTLNITGSSNSDYTYHWTNRFGGGTYQLSTVSKVANYSVWYGDPQTGAEPNWATAVGWLSGFEATDIPVGVDTRPGTEEVPTPTTEASPSTTTIPAPPPSITVPANPTGTHEEQQTGLLQQIKDGISGGFNWLGDRLGGLLGWIGERLLWLGDIFGYWIRWLWERLNGILSAIRTAINAVGDTLIWVMTVVRDAIVDLGSLLGTIAQTLISIPALIATALRTILEELFVPSDDAFDFSTQQAAITASPLGGAIATIGGVPDAFGALTNSCGSVGPEAYGSKADLCRWSEAGLDFGSGGAMPNLAMRILEVAVWLAVALRIIRTLPWSKGRDAGEPVAA